MNSYTSEELIAKFKNIKVWKDAKYKPFLILFALGRLIHGNSDPISFTEFEKKLQQLVKQFDPHNSKLAAAHVPFWRLQNDGVWEVQNKSRYRVNPRGDVLVTSLREGAAVGNFPSDVQTTLDKDKLTAYQIVFDLLDAYFSDNVHDDILLATGITTPNYAFFADLSSPRKQNLSEPNLIVAQHRKRNLIFAPAVLKTYGYQCAVCKFSVAMIRNNFPIALESAHIKWRCAGGPDSLRNGLALCALHHLLFVQGAFTLSSNLKVIVADCIDGNGFEASLEQFHTKAIHLPKTSEDQPDSEFIEWHSEQVFMR